MTLKSEVLGGRPEIAAIGAAMISMAYAKISWNMYSMRFSAVLCCSAAAVLAMAAERFTAVE